MIAARTIDASKLPHSVLDHRSPIWWGNLMLLLIETTMFGLVVATYFYFRTVDFQQWPPPQVNQFPPILRPVPDLPIPIANLAVILLSCAPMIWVDRSCLRRNASAVKIGLAICIAFGMAAIALRVFEFSATKFRWDDNAYASTVWTILGMHMLHLITGACENSLMFAWILLKGMDDKHARDIRVNATYWYWIAGVWLILFGIVFLGPRFL